MVVETRRSLGPHYTTPPRQPQGQGQGASPRRGQSMYPETNRESVDNLNISKILAGEDDDLDTDSLGKDSESSAESEGIEHTRILENDAEANIHDKYTKIAAVMAILAFLIGVIFIATQTGDIPSPMERTQNYDQFIASIRSSIRPSFPNLSEDTKALLRLMGKHVYINDDESPLVVVISGSGSEEFAQKLGSVFQNGKSGLIRVSRDTDRAKLHEKLRNALGGQMTEGTSTRSAVVTNIDLLQWDAVLVVHAFADHSKYPVPNTVLLLTTSEEFQVDSGDQNCDETTTKYLRKRWIDNGGSSDNIPPIISRLGHFMCI